MINELEYKILKEVKRSNNSNIPNIRFSEITSWCFQRKYIKEYFTAYDTILKLINDKYLKADDTYEYTDINDLITITPKGEKAINEYEHKDDPTPVKNFARDVGVEVASQSIMAILTPTLSLMGIIIFIFLLTKCT